jgi:uncharacterized membrane protein
MPIIQRLKQRDAILLLLILVAAFILRFYRLGLESFWMDELYVMVETDPTLPVDQLFHYLKCCDQHPPLFYLCEKIFFYLFGQSEVSARILPAAAGTAGVWAMYLLGKEIRNKQLGLIAAALACVNYFEIYYSREARGYSFEFLFSALSLVFLFRLIKNLRLRDMWFYSLFALCAIYSHYFGVFLLLGEFGAAFVLFFSDQRKRLYFRRFSGSALIILAGFAVWLPVFLTVGRFTLFWLSPTPGNWLFVFFDMYFGKSPDLTHIMTVLLIIYVVGVFASRSWKWPGTARSGPALSLVVLGVTVLLSYGIPYLRSVLVTPMLVDRYTIIVLPCLLVAIAYGIAWVPGKWGLKYIGLAVILFMSLQRNITFFKMYSKHYKTQFREVTAYIAGDKTADHYPILNDGTGWFEAWYLTKYSYPGPLVQLPRAAAADSLIKRTSPRFDAGGFWVMDAHHPADPSAYFDTATRVRVDSFFVLSKEVRFLDAWARLYTRRPAAAPAAAPAPAAGGKP